MTKKSRPDFLPLTDILKKELANLAQGKIKNTITLDHHWKSIVGEIVAENAKVLYVKGGILHIGVSSSTWLQELSFMRQAILSGVRQILPDIEVNDIKFRIAD